MKRKLKAEPIKASSSLEGRDTVTVAVNFNGFIGCDEEYEIDVNPGDTEDDIRWKAIDEAKWDLSVDDEDDGSYCVSFAGFIGADEWYEADDEDDAIEQAADDLSAEIIYDEED